MAAVDIRDNLLGISWVDSSWIPILNSGSVLDYFSERSNPFYDRMCNNEVVKMQRLTLEHLNQMVGVEYILLHAQEPILFIIRKQQRQSSSQVIPLADYYIIAGVIYQAPDLGSVINSRVLTAVHGIQSAFDEAMSYCRYHPSKGYWWHFRDQEEQAKVGRKARPSGTDQEGAGTRARNAESRGEGDPQKRPADGRPQRTPGEKAAAAVRPDGWIASPGGPAGGPETLHPSIMSP
ncbi:mediator of RNA polymerase II transcription subunit 6 isoform X2 [Tachyglossus aculeatus]|uniref:mediator of RNA polymerase II transcription subunit 6 isoform X2 n=1 Tax=Tachyglossus aculeatus TaxID=9261 RepID=UPI0018F27F84|nr:mediator of RNA polymerase II transcription subunit 6 isoform X2 [Tachyglossus aculeatus]